MYSNFMIALNNIILYLIISGIKFFKIFPMIRYSEVFYIEVFNYHNINKN